MGEFLSLSEMTLIKNLMAEKTDEQIAAIIGKSSRTVGAFCKDLKNPPNRTGGKRKYTRRAKPREVPLEVKEKMSLQEKERFRLNQVQEAERRRTERKKEIEKKKYAVKEPNLNGKVSYRLNHKTEVWAKPGADIEALKKLYKIK